MNRAENLKLSVSEDASTVVAEGQIDSHTSQALEDALAGATADSDLALHLAGVSFIDSSGLRVIVRTHKRHVDGGGQLTILAPSDAVTRLLDITGLTSQLQIVPGTS